MKSLKPIYDILLASLNLGIDYSNNINMIDRNYHDFYHKEQVVFNCMSKD